MSVSGEEIDEDDSLDHQKAKILFNERATTEIKKEVDGDGCERRDPMSATECDVSGDSEHLPQGIVADDLLVESITNDDQIV